MQYNYALSTSLKQVSHHCLSNYVYTYIYFRIKDYFVDLVNQLLKDQNVDVIFNVVKHMKDILGSQYNVNIIK